MRVGNTRYLWTLSVAALVTALALPALAKPKLFSSSEDAGKEDEPAKFLSGYDKLVEGKDADWVFYSAGSLKAFKSVVVKDFTTNAVEDHMDEAKHAAEYGKRYLTQWLKKGGFTVVESGGDLTVEGNIFDAWEPSGGARVWGGWMANPGCGLEVVAKDSSGKVVAEIRHKSRGSTVKDAVENGLEEITKSFAAGK